MRSGGACFASHSFEMLELIERDRFNLNSHIDEPAWVGPSYLGALLDQVGATSMRAFASELTPALQCETEGYSVFVVRATGTPNPLHTSPADELARTLPSAAAASSGAVESSPVLGNDSEEDADLQAALRASMAQTHIGGSAAEAGPSAGSSRAAGGSASGSGRPPHGTRRARSVELGSDDELRGGLGMGDSGPETDAHVDALAPSRQRARLLPQSLPHASGARNRRRASRARQGRDEQSGASRETAISLESDEDEGASQDGTASAHRSPFLNPVLAGAALDGIEDLDDDDDEIAFHSLENSDEERDAPVPSGPRRDRTYDDEDADLQRALAASMRDAGGFEEDGFAFTGSSRQQQPERTPPPADVDRITKLRAEAKRQEAQAQEDADRKARGLPTRAEEERKAASGSGAEDSSDEEDEPAEVLSPDEIRRRRLARFGA
jgi:ataxin-3